jgi:hypothetical protein
MSDQMVSLVRCVRCATSLAWEVNAKTWVSMKTGKTVCPQGGPHKVFTPKLEDGAFDGLLDGTPVQEDVAVTYAADMDTATETIAPTFNAQDRCDRCGAQALARAEHEGLSDLLFCKHHINEQRDGLTAAGWTISA